MKTVLITGINRGLGKELFDLFSERNYYVIGLTRDLDYVASSRINTRIVYGDVTHDSIIKDLKEAMGDRPVDLLINNAGIGGMATKLGSVKSQELMQLFDVHCLGVLRIVNALEHNLLKSVDPVVINLNSRLGSIKEQSKGTFRNLEVSYAYRIAKAAQNMLTNCLRNEFDGRIKFISLNPGKMKTQISQTDANLEPQEAALNIVEHFERGGMVELDGIMEINGPLLDW